MHASPSAAPLPFRSSALTRRQVLAAGAGLAAAALPGMALASRSRIGAESAGVIVIHLRGGADGLSLCIPHGDPDLPALRPDLVPRSGLIPIDDLFSLPAEFSPLAPLLARGSLAIIHAVGLPGASRSHAVAQQQIELGWPVHSARVNREKHNPLSLREQVLEAAHGLERDASERIAVIEHEGWDTHTDQNLSGGPFSQSLTELADALHAGHDIITSRTATRPIRILVLTEFGRTIGQNLQRGTDHGEGSVAMLLGRDLPSRGINARWPGLAGRSRSDALPITTDLREVIDAATHS